MALYPRSWRRKLINNGFSRFVAGIVFIYFYCEYLIYYVTQIQCGWPFLNNEPENGVKPVYAMILADTHLLASNGHWFDKWRREWQMHRGFQTALTLHRPDVVFVLGDLFDDGKSASEKEFTEYVARFNNLFRVPESTPMYPVVGNHDIGFHYRGNHFVLINSMAMEGDGCSLCARTVTDIDRIAEWNALHRTTWNSTQHTEEFWVEVYNFKNAVGDRTFCHVSKLALGIMSLPFSNAVVERAFSQVAIIKDKLRNRLAINTAESILRVRYTMMDGCINFQPSEKMLKKFNSEKMLELTLAIIKPHAVKNPIALSYIRQILKNKFVVVNTKRVSLDKETASNFYKEHLGKFFYNRLVTFMTSGCIDLHVLGHMDAIKLWRQMLGPTNFSFYRWHNQEETTYRKGPIIFNNHLFRHPDAAPLPEREHLFEERWDCLSKESTEYLVESLAPRAAFGGHTHHSCAVRHSFVPTHEHKIEFIEYTVPSFSWRNRPDPKYYLATITPNEVKVSKCGMPRERTLQVTAILMITQDSAFRK
ncbi:Metallophosphoesterase 1 [Operophtera brumata]|uniref:Metallophosphoesterase 1 n=1 Tax=Operophtera brumata TaxID=104452 RepID=A0A0L7LQ67_OPEBR|nr:Metallophosphoesterase 1 [Operophtera brumata]